MKIVMVGPFGLKAKSTMRERALPMAKALAKRGHRLSLIVPPWDSPEDAGQAWVEAGVQIINTPLPTLKGPFFYVQLSHWLTRITLAQEPEVVHLFKPKAFAGLTHVCLYYLRRLGRHQALLVVDEDDWEQAWNDKNNYPPWQKLFFAWQEPWGLKHADEVTVASKALYRLVVKLKVPYQQVHYVPNGLRPMPKPLSLLRDFAQWQERFALVVDEAVDASAEADASAKANVPTSIASTLPSSSNTNIATIQANDFSGRIRAKYNLFGKPVILVYTLFTEFQVESLVAIMHYVKQYLAEARWLVVGRGYFAEEEQLAHLVHTQGLTGQVILAGWVSQSDLPYYFTAANVALHLYDDTLINRTKCSVKLLDLLTAGVAVVASQVGQNVEYIIHNQTGYLVPPHNPKASAQALVQIAMNHAYQYRLSQQAMRHVKQHFRWATLVDRVEKVYEQANVG